MTMPVIQEDEPLERNGQSGLGLRDGVRKWQILVLALPNLGIQMLWLVVMSYGTPHMAGLGMPTSLTALIWLSGPLSGTLVQPVFAALSDRTTHPWGRRKPYIAGGASFVCLSLLGLACAEDVSNWLTGSHPSHHHVYASGPPKSSTLTKLLVAFWACAINVAVQPLQSGVRALTVDSCPPHQQSEAAAWSARFNGLGAVLISASAVSDISAWAPLLGDTKFKALCVLAVLALAATVIPACFLIADAPASTDYGCGRSTMPGRRQGTVTRLLAGARSRFSSLPPVTRQVCKIQFCAWLGWFSVLYYLTTYVYQVFVMDQHIHLDPNIFGSADPRLIEMGKQAGTRASFYFACVTFASACILPFVVVASPPSSSTFSDDDNSSSNDAATTTSSWRPSVGRAWLLAHCLFAALMFLTTFVWTAPAAIVIVAALGLAWGVASWAPYTLIGAEIAGLREAAARRAGWGEMQERGGSGEYWEGSSSGDEKGAGSVVGGEEGEERSGGDDATAAVMAVHNMAISVPQICAALVCSALFKVVEAAGRDDPAAYAFKLAGVAAAAAAWMARDLE
ncbi:sucrose transporter [Diplodia corticola]|uniref:Sucrose transporter n=1 Tax=Diplodia corticola TaxID=236234 RepID=A0A1J9R1N9_9PEZI|nr:sucrose transporter [Diplodia corticola]OJD34162.1 sucrose transporter [Diplodia corticola]